MGAWGNGHFENDGALDFVVELTSQGTLAPVEEALNDTFAESNYIVATYGECALAAAEVVAFLLGKPSPSLPEGVTAWQEQHQIRADNALVNKAIRAVELCRDREKSELAELWEEVEDDEWLDKVDGLLMRLKA